MKFFLLINVKMPTIIDILTFMNIGVGRFRILRGEGGGINVKIPTIVDILTFMNIGVGRFRILKGCVCVWVCVWGGGISQQAHVIITTSY